MRATELGILAVTTGIAAAIVGPLIGTILSAAKDLIRETGEFIFGWFFISKEFYSDTASEAMVFHLSKQTKYFNQGGEMYDLKSTFVRPLNETRSIWTKRLDKSWRLFWVGKWPALFVPDSGYPAKMVYLRGTVDFEKLLLRIEEAHATFMKDKKSKKFAVIRYTDDGMTVQRKKSKGGSDESHDPPSDSSETQSMFTPSKPIGWNEEDLGPSLEGARLSDLSLSPALHNVVRDIRFWHSHRQWYADRGVPWRRGYLLYGAPGSGKTSMARAIAEDLDMTVHVFDLASLNNSSFTTYWARARTYGPRIVLLEDFDAVFRGRENISPNGELTFDTLLNVLDGVEREDGLLLFVTTNHLEHIDPAMGIPDGSGRSTRPGRIDKTVLFEPLDRPGRFKLALRILQDEKLANELADSSTDATAAQFQEEVMQYALGLLWGKESPTNVPT